MISTDPRDGGNAAWRTGPNSYRTNPRVYFDPDGVLSSEQELAADPLDLTQRQPLDRPAPRQESL